MTHSWSPGGCIGRLAVFLLVVLGVLLVAGSGGIRARVDPDPDPTPIPAAVVASDVSGALDALIGVGGRLVLVAGVLGAAMVAFVIPARFAFSSTLGADLLAVIQSFTGNWEPDAAPDPEPVREKTVSIERVAELEELVQFSKSALVAGSWNYHQMRGAGWQGGARRWQSLIDQVSKDGFAVKVSSNGGQKWQWIGKGVRPFHNALSHYASEFLRVGRP